MDFNLEKILRYGKRLAFSSLVSLVLLSGCGKGNNSSEAPTEPGGDNPPPSNTQPYVTKLYVGSNTFNGFTGFNNLDEGEIIQLGAEFFDADGDEDIDYHIWRIINFTNGDVDGLFLGSTPLWPNGAVYQAPDITYSKEIHVEVDVFDYSNAFGYGIITLYIN